MSHENWPPPEPRQRRLWSGGSTEPPPAPPPAAPPPPPPPPQRRDRFPIVAGALAVLAVGAIVGAIVSSSDHGSKPRRQVGEAHSRIGSTTTFAPSVPSTPSSTPPPPPVNPRHLVRRASVGSIAAGDDGVMFRVPSIRPVRSIPHTRFTGPIVGTSRQQLIRADIVYVNHTGAPIDVFCGGYGATLQDSEKHRHEPLHNYLDIRGNDDVCSTKIEPGGTSHVTFAFLVPRSRSVAGLYVYNAKAADFDGADSKIYFAAR
jgi:hypothetical protein